jgi:hypothetical protein
LVVWNIFYFSILGIRQLTIVDITHMGIIPIFHIGNNTNFPYFSMSTVTQSIIFQRGRAEEPPSLAPAARYGPRWRHGGGGGVP